MRILKSGLLILLLVAAIVPSRLQAQDDTPCGIVDSIDYPIDGISIDYDDFGMYRAPFNGWHTGIDMAFGRYGDPVRAAARGRVTYSDTKGWDTEKGVVIIQHFFPGGLQYFTLYGHMEELNGFKFPKAGQCVEKGEIIGAVGHPSRGAPHLHYETRTRAAVSGGPGYFSSDPLDAGWLHPIDFTEGWKLRFSPAFRSMVTAGGGQIGPPVWRPDGHVVFAEYYHLEERDADSQRVWRLDMQGLEGIVGLPDGRILARTIDDQIIILDGQRFDQTWKADRDLRSAPMLLGNAIAFLGADNRIVAYNLDGTLRWQTDSLGDYVDSYTQSGERLAVSAAQGSVYKVAVIDSSGAVVYRATAPSPVSITAAAGGFYLLVATQIDRLGPDLKLTPLMDVGQALWHNSQIAMDGQGSAVIYPGQGRQVFAYNANGGIRWAATLPEIPRETPLIGIGSGCLAYVLTSDGSLLAYRMTDGALRGLATLYAGGTQSQSAARFLHVSPTDQVQFSAGYLSIATIDGPTLAAMPCGR
ncbi:MAG TPA: peptidoglycan DD-metalloendopeptidase family protein [Aggregatilineales bacterium]|nr:peptidoglycan DD-metalloendopeptidase family protein [Aggregatilineales bacterium]